MKIIVIKQNEECEIQIMYIYIYKNYFVSQELSFCSFA